MRLDIPDVPPSLNTLSRMHWAAQRRLTKKWILWVRSQMNYVPNWLPGKMRVKVTLCHARLYDECDNMQGACKPLFDALKSWNLIRDDSPHWIGKPEIAQEKCAHKKRHTTVEIEPAGGA